MVLVIRKVYRCEEVKLMLFVGSLDIQESSLEVLQLKLFMRTWIFHHSTISIIASKYY